MLVCLLIILKICKFLYNTVSGAIFKVPTSSLFVFCAILPGWWHREGMWSHMHFIYLWGVITKFSLNVKFINTHSACATPLLCFKVIFWINCCKSSSLGSPQFALHLDFQSITLFKKKTSHFIVTMSSMSSLSLYFLGLRFTVLQEWRSLFPMWVLLISAGWPSHNLTWGNKKN